MTGLSTPIPVITPLQEVVRTAIRIRAFESGLLDCFKKGLLSGTVHTCIGQEFCAAALHPHLQTGKDGFFATHRGHGHYLAYGGSTEALLAELMGREGALCLGRGGTQNLHFQRFFSAGIQGGFAPVGTGFAWAMKQRGEDAIAVVQIGDGTLGEGALYEAFTFSVLLQSPVLFLLECNGWAQSTDVRTTTPGDITQRAAGFGLDFNVADDSDPSELFAQLGRAVAFVRSGRPFLQVIRTRRLMAHSKGDDNRPQELIDQLWETDPLTRILQAVDARMLAADEEAELERQIQAVVALPKLVDAGQSALPPPKRPINSLSLHADAEGRREYDRVAAELNKALHELMASSREVMLVGEDLLDPYGGAFKVSRGLSTKFPAQVFSSPIAEAGIVGVCNGLALAGFRPVAEIMFADFVTLATDQLINFAAKFHYMFAGKVTCPLTVRLVSGGGRGYGPTHSQSLERLFCGVPGLRVIALSQRHNPASLLSAAVMHDDSPKVFVENKLLYSARPEVNFPLDCQPVAVEKCDGTLPPLCYVASQGRADVTVVTYGGMTAAVEAAMARLFEEDELAFDYIILTQLWPLDVTEIVDSVRRSERLVVVEENFADYGVGSAIISRVVQAVPGLLCRAVGAKELPIPSVRHLEDQVLPSVEDVMAAITAVTCASS